MFPISLSCFVLFSSIRHHLTHYFLSISPIECKLRVGVDPSPVTWYVEAFKKCAEYIHEGSLAQMLAVTSVHICAVCTALAKIPLGAPTFKHNWEGEKNQPKVKAH